uniref:Transmembrane protein n=1 Tax=Caenorhabditis tropicalis TaxID=1561998 RepID=A0A1I7U668_9PELO
MAFYHSILTSIHTMRFTSLSIAFLACALVVSGSVIREKRQCGCAQPQQSQCSCQQVQQTQSCSCQSAPVQQQAPSCSCAQPQQTQTVQTTIRLILVYFIVFNIGLCLLGLPWFSIYIGGIGLGLCIFTCYHVYRKNDKMMFPFYLYVLFTIFYLLFLGGYFFFVNIFHKEMVKGMLSLKYRPWSDYRKKCRKFLKNI